MKELRELFTKINKKYIELKEEKNARRRQEDDVDSFLDKKQFEIEERLSSEESSKLWQTVIKKKKNSRRKH